MLPNEIVRIKKNKQEIPANDLKQIIWEYSHGQISDKDMTKLLKAIYKNGMTRKEIFALTESMIDSGEKMDFTFLILIYQKITHLNLPKSNFALLIIKLDLILIYM